MMNKAIFSKVASLANRLTPKMDGNKSAAFFKAWTLVKAASLEITVKGTSFKNRQEALKRLSAYDPAQIQTVLVPEANNPADPAAIAVLVGVNNGKGLYHMGYVPHMRLLRDKQPVKCWESFSLRVGT